MTFWETALAVAAGIGIAELGTLVVIGIFYLGTLVVIGIFYLVDDWFF